MEGLFRPTVRGSHSIGAEPVLTFDRPKQKASALHGYLSLGR